MPEELHEEEQLKEKAIASLIASTKRLKRRLNLLEVADKIEWLRNHLGSLNIVANTVGLSEEMLREFLSVKKLSPKVLSLLENGIITSVDLAYRISKLPPQEQQMVADRFIEGKLSSKDVRVIVALRNKLATETIGEVIARVLKSKNIKVFVLLFPLTKGTPSLDTLHTRFSNFIGNEISSFRQENNTAILEITPLGKKRLLEAAKARHLTLKKLVGSLINEGVS